MKWYHDIISLLHLVQNQAVAWSSTYWITLLVPWGHLCSQMTIALVSRNQFFSNFLRGCNIWWATHDTFTPWAQLELWASYTSVKNVSYTWVICELYTSYLWVIRKNYFYEYETSIVEYLTDFRELLTTTALAKKNHIWSLIWKSLGNCSHELEV